MDRGIEDTSKKHGRDDRVRGLLGLAPLPFDPPTGAYRTTPTTIASPTFSNISTISSSSRRSGSDSASRRSSTSTALSSAPSIAHDGTPPWHNQRSMATDDYELPCEFEMLGCGIRYHRERWEDWIAHSLSHFIGNDPPSSTVCIFCDDPAAYVHHQNPQRTWRARMIHIGRHHQEYRGRVGPRPDYFLLKHLKRYQLIANEDYEDNMSFTERQPCDYLVDPNFQTPEMKERERKNAKAAGGTYDMRNEKRQMRQEEGKGRSGRSTHKSTKSSRKAEVYYEPRS